MFLNVGQKLEIQNVKNRTENTLNLLQFYIKHSKTKNKNKNERLCRDGCECDTFVQNLVQISVKRDSEVFT